MAAGSCSAAAERSLSTVVVESSLFLLTTTMEQGDDCKPNERSELEVDGSGPGEPQVKSVWEVVHESSDKIIYHAVDDDTSMAVKVLSEPNPDPIVLSLLYNEYSILTLHLSECRPARPALKKGQLDGCSALYLGWADGITLQQWMNTNDLPKSMCGYGGLGVESGLLRRVRLAHSVVTAVVQIHDSGVVHDNLSPDNIIVNPGFTADGKHHSDGFQVSIIDFQRARAVKDPPVKPSILDSAAVLEQAADLRSLGSIFYELFSGQVPKHQTLDAYVLFSEAVAGTNFVIPKSVVDLVTCLMMESGTALRSSDDQYQSSRELEEDLKSMVDRPGVFFLDKKRPSEGTPVQFLISSDKLYGRDEHVSILSKVFDRLVMPDMPPEVVFIHGYSGSGKTALAHLLQRPLEEMGGFFITGKFDQLQRVQPYSSLTTAFAEFCDRILGGCKALRIEMKEKIISAVGSEGKVLTDVIPNLEKIIGVQKDVAKVGGIEAKHRLSFVFRKFVCAVSSPAHPLLLFMDDMQWTDEGSLDVIKSLVTDVESKSFMLLACYRENEVSGEHPFSIMMQEVEDKNVATTRLDACNLHKDAVNEMISDTLQMSRKSVRSFTEVIYQKTHGNMFFIIKLLQSLRDRDLLYFDVDALVWRWDVEGIAAVTASVNVIELTVGKIQSLNTDCQNLLKVAACVGFYFEASILDLLIGSQGDKNRRRQGQRRRSRLLTTIGDRRISVPDHLQLAVQEGLIEKAISTSSRYRFAHDKIHQAAYSLVPEDEQDLLHLYIGEHLCRHTLPAEMESLIFVVVDQLNRGMSCMTEHDDRTNCAKLNLDAGKKALLSSAFEPAVKYLDTSIKLLGDRLWDDHYDISIEIFSTLAESLYCVGKFDRIMTEIWTAVDTNAKTFQDKLRLYSVKLHAYGAQGNLRNAIDEGFSVLSLLGEVFPKKVGMATIAKDLWTKVRLRGKSDEYLFTLPFMKDVSKKAAMKFLSSMMLYTYLSRPEYMPLLAFRMIRLTLRYGNAPESANAYAVYGVILCSSGVGDYHGGCRFGKFALSLVDRLNYKEWRSRVYLTVFGCINAWTQHVSKSLDPFLHAYHAGMECGDIEIAMYNLGTHVAYSLYSGSPLADVELNLRQFTRQMREYKQNAALSVTIPLHQCVLNLMGMSKNPSQLNGDLMEVDAYLAEAESESNMTKTCSIRLNQLWMAYTFGEYKLASEYAEKAKEVEIGFQGKIEVCFQSYFTTLTAVEMARETRQEHWRKMAQNGISKMMKWSKYTPENFLQKELLMKAEYKSLFIVKNKNGRKHSKKIEKLYEAAIRYSMIHEFIQDEAISYERYGLFYHRLNDTDRAFQCFTQAIRCYQKWGAMAKVDQLTRLYACPY